eukprot:365568-Chlamydomonas_euryale.AAC.4
MGAADDALPPSPEMRAAAAAASLPPSASRSLRLPAPRRCPGRCTPIPYSCPSDGPAAASSGVGCATRGGGMRPHDPMPCSRAITLSSGFTVPLGVAAAAAAASSAGSGTFPPAAAADPRLLPGTSLPSPAAVTVAAALPPVSAALPPPSLSSDASSATSMRLTTLSTHSCPPLPLPSRPLSVPVRHDVRSERRHDTSHSCCSSAAAPGRLLGSFWKHSSRKSRMRGERPDGSGGCASRTTRNSALIGCRS